MGNCCQNSESSESASENLKLESIGIQALNDLFSSAYAPLQTLSEVSDGLSEAIVSYQKSTSTNILRSCNSSDSIFGMFYIFSANVENVFTHLCFKFVDKSPYLDLDKKKLPQHVVRIYDDWENLALNVKEAPGKLEEIKPQIEGLIEEAKEFPERAKDLCSAQGVNPLETLSSLKSVAKNIQKLMTAKSILFKTSDTVQEILVALKDFGSNFEENSSKIKEIGDKARGEKILMPRDVIKNFWPEPNRVDQDLVRKEEEEERKAEEAKKSE